MSKFAIGEEVENAAGDHEVGTVVAVFPTVEGGFRYLLTRKDTARSSFSSRKNYSVGPPS